MAPTNLNSRHLRLCAGLFKTAAVSPCVVVSLVLVVPTHLRTSRCLPVFARYHLSSSVLIRMLSGFPSESISWYVFLLIVSAPYLACEGAQIVFLLAMYIVFASCSTIFGRFGNIFIYYLKFSSELNVCAVCNGRRQPVLIYRHRRRDHT